MQLLTEQGDLSVETFLAKGLCCNGAGHAAADNDEVGFGVHRQTSSWAAIKVKNSAREAASLRSWPCSAEVTVLAPDARTPRTVMQRCSAATTTPKPRSASSS